MKLLIPYVILFLILMGCALLYFKIAQYYHIIDKPNERSSHDVPTIRGGGILFLLSTILFFFWSGYSYPWLLVSMLAAGFISFIDDLRMVNNRLKFSVHILSVFLIFVACGLIHTLPFLYLFALGIVAIGVINAYNFMDGINGITGLYSLAVVVPLCLTEFDSTLQTLQLFSITALVVFNFYNTRKNARCFAGDVGSISLAILVVFLLVMRIAETNQYAYVGLLLLYGIDTVFTIMQRLYQQENIFKPHRKHFYQYLSNEQKMPHIRVSALYAIIQLLINLAIVYSYLSLSRLIILLLLLSIFYWILKAPYLQSSKVV